MDRRVYDLTLENIEDGMLTISLVTSPATQIGWFTFDEHKKYHFINEEERIVTSIVMEPDMEIVRYDSNGNKYYVRFSEKTIKEMAYKYFRENRINNVDINHDGNLINSGVTLIEAYFINENKLISKLFPDASNGSYVVSFKIDDTEIWENIKNKKLCGFSLEGNFTPKEIQTKTKLSMKQKFINELNKLFDNFISEDEVIEVKFLDMKTIDNRIFHIEGEEISIGLPITELVEDGSYIPIENGTYELEDGSSIVITDGLIELYNEVVEETEVEVVEVELSDMTEMETKLLSYIDSLIKNTNELTNNVNELKDKYTSLLSENETIKFQIEEFKKLPSTTETITTPKFSNKKQNMEDKLSFYSTRK